MNHLLIWVNTQANGVSDELMPLLTQNIVISLAIVTMLIFFGRSGRGMKRTSEGE
jgi:hypothetical protein